jgi:murein DD-endopeptidase MepM/ murein hydrolase activator NlpD
LNNHASRLTIVLAAALLLVGTAPADPKAAQPPDAPVFQLPFSEPPGPTTWLLFQPYGNTAFAFRYRRSVYINGQGLHFGIDLAAACGTPVVAIGDGTVAEVDSPAHGAGPHNLMIDHPNGLASFYGHLLARPQFRLGDQVSAGEVVAVSGDPDLTCTSRPHLHLEIRSAPDHRVAYNPLPLIRADWHRIGLVGSEPIRFEQDLADPEKWLTMMNQPPVQFGAPLLNDYESAWPPAR